MRIPSFALLLAVASGCSSSDFTVGTAAEEDGSTADTTGSGPADGSNPDEGTDTTSEMDTAVTIDAPLDTPSDDTGPLGCDPMEVPDVAIGVFVSAAAGSDTGGDGSKLSPYKTIATGLATAKTLGRSRVYLDVGTYAESVVFHDATPGIIVDGGWTATGAIWKRNCAVDARAMTVISGGANAVLFDGVHHRSGLRHLTAKTKSKGAITKAASGESTIAVFVRNTDAIIELGDVALIAGDAADGGLAGEAGPSTAASCGACAMLPTGTTGTNGAPGSTGSDAKVPGSYGSSGFTPPDGVGGGTGSAGSTGGPPGAPESAACVASCTGMGGVCGGFCGHVDATKSGGNGACGCGGNGGGAGAPGRGGGASIGVLVVSGATVQITNSLVHAGNGGSGSVGGAGADGTAGFPGAAGAVAYCDTDCGRSGMCECVPTGTKKLAGGSTGGAGGAGGKGGSGGAGGGGPSYAYVNIGGTVTVAKTKLEHGTGGTGAGGAVIGTAGDSFP